MNFKIEAERSFWTEASYLSTSLRQAWITLTPWPPLRFSASQSAWVNQRIDFSETQARGYRHLTTRMLCCSVEVRDVDEIAKEGLDFLGSLLKVLSLIFLSFFQSESNSLLKYVSFRQDQVEEAESKVKRVLTMSAVGQRERNLEQRSTTSRTPRLQLKPSSSNSISHLTSSTPISRSKTHRRPISPPPPPPPPLTSNTQSFNRNSKAIELPSRPISPTSLSPSHGPISFSRPTRASHLRQLSSNSVRSSISSNASSNISIRSKRISQPVFLGSSNNGLSNNDQSENQTHSNHLSQKQVTHKPLPTPPTSSPSRDSFSTPTKSNSGQHPPPVNNNFQSQSNDLKSKFSVSPDTRNKRSRIRKEKERERANRSTDKKIFGGTGLSGDLENENGVTGETFRSIWTNGWNWGKPIWIWI